MKNTIWIISLMGILGLSACTTDLPIPQTSVNATETVESPAASEDLFVNTSMGEFVIASSRFVDEVNGDKPGPGEKLLLVILTKPGEAKLEPSDFSLEEFQTMVHDTTQGEINILGSDGSRTISTMAGWVGPEYQEFAMGFRLPGSITTYQLDWPGNGRIDLKPTE